MKKEIIKLSPLQIINNDIEEVAKNGGGRFKLSDWEYQLGLDHNKVVAIVWSIEEMRIMEGKRIFVKIESYGKKGRPILSEIEVPKDNKIGKARTIGEFLKRDRAVRLKKARVERGIESTLKDMKCLKPRDIKKYILLSDSRK